MEPLEHKKALSFDHFNGMILKGDLTCFQSPNFQQAVLSKPDKKVRIGESDEGER